MGVSSHDRGALAGAPVGRWAEGQGALRVFALLVLVRVAYRVQSSCSGGVRIAPEVPHLVGQHLRNRHEGVQLMRVNERIPLQPGQTLIKRVLRAFQ